MVLGSPYQCGSPEWRECEDRLDSDLDSRIDRLEEESHDVFIKSCKACFGLGFWGGKLCTSCNGLGTEGNGKDDRT